MKVGNRASIGLLVLLATILRSRHGLRMGLGLCSFRQVLPIRFGGREGAWRKVGQQSNQKTSF